MRVSHQIQISGCAFMLSGILFLPIVRRTYLKHGSLTPAAAFLQIVVWFFYQLFLAIAVWHDPWPAISAYIPKNWIGAVLMLFGLGLCIVGAWTFRSMTRLTGQRADQLIVRGVYRWTRNPQYLGYGIFVLGVVVAYWSATAWLSFLAYALLAYVTARIEEQHLLHIFGESYRQYCLQVPRFLSKNSWRQIGGTYG